MMRVRSAGISPFLLLCLSLLASVGLGDRVDIYPNSFVGGWACDVQFMDVMGSPYLIAHGLGHRVLDSKATANVPKAGEWRVWVRTRTWVDAGDAKPNPSAFRVAVAGQTLEKTFGLGGDAWHWEDGGMVTLPAGRVQIALKDLSGFDARCAGIVLANAGERPEGALSVADAPVAETVSADLVVVGGGVPGVCAAIAAARSGLKVALVQDRPILGGNASSEIRVWSAGELCNDIVREVRGRFMNKEAEASIVDGWRSRVVADETNIDCRVSHRAFAADMKGGSIAAVKALDVAGNRVVRFAAPLFVDATGDGWVGYWAGADYRMGREAASEFGETMAPEKADGDTLGASLMWTSYCAGADEPFSAPWAESWAQGETAVNGEWNWEYGIHRDMIAEGEAIRDRLLLAIYGAFSNAKRNPQYRRNVLNFVPFLLGKRESRRLMGDYVYSEKDVSEKREFPDAVAKGSWSVDLHYDTCKPGVDFLTVCKQPHFGRYYIPFRSLYSRNVPNLMMCGRCFSATHVGMGGARVINTLATMGVAVGYAASLCRDMGITPREVYAKGLVRSIQRKIGGDWPGNPDPAHAHWRIVDNEDASVTFGAKWRHSFNANGGTINDKFAAVDAGDLKAAGDATFPLPVTEKGRYELYRNVPFLPWCPLSSECLAELTSGGKTTELRFRPFVNIGNWVKVGDFDLEPGATLKVVPSKSHGFLIIDAFAVVPIAK